MVRVKVVPMADEGHTRTRSLGTRVPSLLFDLDLSESAQHSTAEPVEETSAEVEHKLVTLLQPWSEPEYMLLLHVRFAREDAAKRGQLLSVPDLADTLRRLGYAVKMRTALGGGSGGACLRSLRHSFLTVTVAGSSGSAQYVLDPHFRDQFEIAPRACTPRYAKVLGHVSDEVVISHDRLTKVVEILCAEVSLAFQQTGTPLPPWRQQAAMLSKWHPRRSTEEVSLGAMLDRGSELPLAPAGQQPGGAANARRLTGPSTVAQRLAMLGVVQQQSNPSPIAEGVEHVAPELGRAEEEQLALGATASTSSSASSALGLDEGTEEEQPSAPVLQHSPPRHRPPASHAIPAAGRAAGQPRGKAIFEGIRAAAAALPHRRHNTWAG